MSISNQVSFVNPQFIAMFLTMICCIILGMGVPTTANYCIMASTCAPILITMGVPKICAHFFVFYFGIVADITARCAGSLRRLRDSKVEPDEDRHQRNEACYRRIHRAVHLLPEPGNAAH